MLRKPHASIHSPSRTPYAPPFPIIILLFVCFMMLLRAYPLTFLSQAFAATERQSASGTTDDWTMYRHDPSGAGASLDTILTTANAGQLHQAWSYQTGGGISTGVMVLNGVGYVGSWDGNEYAINITNGALIWKTKLGQNNVPACWPNPLGVMATANIVNGELYTAAGDGNFYALNATTGAIDWSIPIADTSATGGYGVYSSPLISNNFAYIGLSSDCDNPNVQGKVLRIDLTARAIANTYLTVPNGQTGAPVWGSPVLDAATNTLYVATGNGTDSNPHIGNSEAILALNAADLSFVGMWQIPLGDFNAGDEDFGTTPVLFATSGGTPMVAAAAKDGYFYGVNRSSLSAGLLWKDAVAVGGDSPEDGDGSISSASYASGVVYIGGGNTTIGGTSYAGSMRAVDPTTGNYLWEHGAPGYVLSASAVVNGMVVDGAGSTLEVLNAGNGQVLYSDATASTNHIYAEPTVAEGMIFFSTSDGVVHALATSAAPSGCPSGWNCADIGGPGMVGSETFNQTTNTWTINGGGSDIWGNADQFHYDWQTVSADGSASAQVTAQTNTSGYAKAGIMFRQSNAANAPFYDAMISPGYGVMIQYRTAAGGNAQEALKTPGTIPIYLQVTRSGGIGFSTSTSTDGVHWSPVSGSSESIAALAGTILSGLAVTAHNNAALSAATFTGVTIPGSAPPPPPTSCATGWTCADVGTPAIVGTAALNTATNVWTISGSGADIWGTADQFQFVNQTLAADGTLSAHVTAQTNTSPYAKAGVMFRQSNAANAAYFLAAISPGYGILIQYRTATGAQAQEVLKAAGTVPIYLQIARTGTSYSVLTSPDGVNWTLVSGSTLALPGLAGSVLAGLAVTAHNNGQLSTATIDTVSLSPAKTTTPTPTPTAGPAVCAANWTCGDIGGPAIAGSASFNTTTGVWTISGGGSDIWGTADQFQYAYQPVSVDSTISAHVTAQTNTNAYAKAGVMFRQSNAANSAYYTTVISPGYGIMIQFRTVAGGNAQEALKVAATVPSYLRIARQGTSFTTYTSTNGTTWTAVAGSTETISFTGGYLAGLAVTAHDNTKISTATMDSVTLTTP